MTIQEAIKERHMVRKYLEKPIPTEIAAQLQERLTEDNQTSGLRLTLVTGNNDPGQTPQLWMRRWGIGAQTLCSLRRHWG